MASDEQREAAAPLRERILREATRLFADHGYAAASVREIASASGCTKPSLYYYFGGKEQLFIEAIRHESEELSRLLHAVIAMEAPIRERLASGMEIVLDHVVKNPMGMRLLMRAELWPDEGQPDYDFESVRVAHFELIKDLIRRGASEGAIREGVDFEEAAFALAGIFEQRLRLWLRGEPIPKDFPAKAVSFLFDGIAS